MPIKREVINDHLPNKPDPIEAGYPDNGMVRRGLLVAGTVVRKAHPKYDPCTHKPIPDGRFYATGTTSDDVYDMTKRYGTRNFREYIPNTVIQINKKSKAKRRPKKPKAKNMVFQRCPAFETYEGRLVNNQTRFLLEKRIQTKALTIFTGERVKFGWTKEVILDGWLSHEGNKHFHNKWSEFVTRDGWRETLLKVVQSAIGQLK